MRVVVVYHAAMGDEARAIFRAMAAIPGIDLTVLSPERVKLDFGMSGWHQLDHPIIGEGYAMESLPLRSPDDYARGFEPGGLRRAIRRIHPDVVHAWDDMRSGYVAQCCWMSLLLRPRPKVLFYAFQNIDLPHAFGVLGRLRWRLTFSLLSGGAGASTDAVELSRRTGLSPHTPMERIFWGVDTSAFSSTERASSRAELGIAEGRVVGYIGRVSKAKGVDVLLEAVGRLEHPVQTVLIGEIDPEMTGIVEATPGARAVGPVRRYQLPRWLSSMDLLVLPSRTTPTWKEQYGRVLVEAMAAGTPVIGSDSGAIPEVIGDAGLVTEEGDPDALARAIDRMFGDDGLRSRSVELGERRAEQQLSAHAMADQLVALYRRVLEER